ncbi:transposase [Rhizobium leguminosarum]|uniref:transposase n=1 Tax=Rhizobium leguminosarum TaxID=384 RepID=UPI0021BC04B2|nr:transposase [Rhizobium leguminosarum]
MSDSLKALDWDELVGRLGSAEELESSAREAGALLRKRQVGGAVDLLRLCFAYVLGGFSLRTLAAWADQRALASMSDVAMLKRLKASADWVGCLVSELLAERCPEAFAGVPGDLRLMAVDATIVAPPGPKRVYWMVHTVFDLSRLRLCSVEVTDRHEAERLSRGVKAGELRIADRAHAKAADLAEVVEAGADFLVRAPSNYPRLLDRDGQLLDRLAHLYRRLARPHQGDRQRPAALSTARAPTKATRHRTSATKLAPMGTSPSMTERGVGRLVSSPANRRAFCCSARTAAAQMLAWTLCRLA